MMKVENILKALGVVDGTTFDALAAALSQGALDGVKVQLVHPNDVVLRLRNFVEAEQRALSSQ
eukprot:238579-Prorocentrum_minimum.AAC.1